MKKLLNILVIVGFLLPTAVLAWETTEELRERRQKQYEKEEREFWRRFNRAQARMSCSGEFPPHWADMCGKAYLINIANRLEMYKHAEWVRSSKTRKQELVKQKKLYKGEMRTFYYSPGFAGMMKACCDEYGSNPELAKENLEKCWQELLKHDGNNHYLRAFLRRGAGAMAKKYFNSGLEIYLENFQEDEGYKDFSDFLSETEDFSCGSNRHGGKYGAFEIRPAGKKFCRVIIEHLAPREEELKARAKEHDSEAHIMLNYKLKKARKWLKKHRKVDAGEENLNSSVVHLNLYRQRACRIGKMAKDKITFGVYDNAEPWLERPFDEPYLEIFGPGTAYFPPEEIKWLKEQYDYNIGEGPSSGWEYAFKKLRLSPPFYEYYSYPQLARRVPDRTDYWKRQSYFKEEEGEKLRAVEGYWKGVVKKVKYFHLDAYPIEPYNFDKVISKHLMEKEAFYYEYVPTKYVPLSEFESYVKKKEKDKALSLKD